MITLWRSVVGEMKKSEWETERQGFEESNESFESVMKVTVGLSRYSSGGSTKLFYDGARSQVRSLPESQKAQMNAQRDYNKLVANNIPMEDGGVKHVIPEENQAVAEVATESDIKI